jgi:hypothetical protein
LTALPEVFRIGVLGVLLFAVTRRGGVLLDNDAFRFAADMGDGASSSSFSGEGGIVSL